MSYNFWDNKNVLITGADGFIGSHLVEHLQKKGARIRALALYNSFNNWGWLEKIEDFSNVDVITGDIRDVENCIRLTEGVDIVFHLASLIAIPYSFRNPRSYIDNNIYGTFNICEASVKSNSKLIYISTSEVYGTAQYLPIDEKHPLQAQSPYSATKISAEAIVYSYFRSFDLQAVIVRPFNTYGPRQSARAIIPSIIVQIASGSKEIKIGNLEPRRDFNYVTDTCDGMTLIAEKDELNGQIVNIGTGKDYQISEVFYLIRNAMNMDVQLTSDFPRKRSVNSEVDHLLCDNTKIKTYTGFSPDYTLEKGLEKTIAWYTNPENISFYKTHIYNV